MSHVPADLTQPAEPPTEPQQDRKPVYDSISTLSRQELSPGAHLPIMQAHPQIRKRPILPNAVQHVTACMAHESARMDNEARAQTTSLSTKASASSPTFYTSAPQLLLPNHMSQIPYQPPHLRTDEAQRAWIPQSLFNRQKKSNTTKSGPRRARFKRSYRRLQESL